VSRSLAPVVDVGSNDRIGWLLAWFHVFPPSFEKVTFAKNSVVPLDVSRSVKAAIS
jgi:hypothetical protein